MPNLTTASFLARVIQQEQQLFAEEAQSMARQAAHVAANPPTAQRTVAGELTRLSQDVAHLLSRASKIEASIAALTLLEADSKR